MFDRGSATEIERVYQGLRSDYLSFVMGAWSSILKADASAHQAGHLLPNIET
jgi:hypothetical protein